MEHYSLKCNDSQTVSDVVTWYHSRQDFMKSRVVDTLSFRVHGGHRNTAVATTNALTTWTSCPAYVPTLCLCATGVLSITICPKQDPNKANNEQTSKAANSCSGDTLSYDTRCKQQPNKQPATSCKATTPRTTATSEEKKHSITTLFGPQPYSDHNPIRTEPAATTAAQSRPCCAVLC